MSAVTQAQTNLIETRVPFRAADGMELYLLRVRGGREPVRGPVILVHGAGVRGNIFRAPVAKNLVEALVENGYEVWLENWRASIDLPPSTWTLDHAAAYDHPQAVATIVRETGWEKIKAVIHCQGSTSFTMSALAGLLPQVTTIVSNAVSLCPVVPSFSFMKLESFLPLLKVMTKYLNPAWGLDAPTWQAKLIRTLVQLTHHECNNTVCKMVSFTYGAGFPALWRHENLNDATHDWLQHEFANVPITFFEQITKCVHAGHLISVANLPELPTDFAAQAPQTEARFALLAGQRNRCFLPESQTKAFAFLNGHRKNYHTLHLLPNYSHLDVFMGKDAYRDTFPLILKELEH